jgi:hypothetical protein
MIVPRRTTVRQRNYRRRGLGFTYYDLLDQAGREDCDPRDSACVNRNTQRVVAVQDLWAQYLSNPATANQAAPQIKINVDTSQAAQAAFMANQPITSQTVSVGGGSAQTVGQLETTGIYAKPQTVAAPSGGGKLTFTTSRGGTTVYPGDTWIVKITGASPNQPVVVVGGRGGSADMNTMGTTDSSGNFTKSGTFSAADAGQWQESWSVGGKPSGSFGFTLQSSVPTTPGGDQIINSSGASQPSNPSAPSVSLFSFSSIPLWVWGAAAAVGLYAMNSKGKR